MNEEALQSMSLQQWVGMLTIMEVCKLFDVTAQTVRNWRKYDRFPDLELETGYATPEVRFHYDEVAAWAANNDRRIYYTYDELMKQRLNKNLILTHVQARKKANYNRKSFIKPTKKTLVKKPIKKRRLRA